jgi:NAD dependent epimerase/dehydratase
VTTSGDWSGKRVLVTGAGGFIGSHLVEHLVRQEARVRAMFHYDSRPGLGNLEHLAARDRKQVEVIAGDICNPFFVRQAIEGVDVVFHLAALIGIPYSYVAPASYVAVNVQGTLNVLEACRQARVERIVHTSTSECYGTARYVPIDEQHPLQAQSPYAATKIAADKLAEAYAYSFALPVCVLRPFNTYGPRQSARAVIPTIASQLLWGGPELRLGSLDPVRDLTYVDDTCDGFLRAASSDRAVGQVVHLGTGQGVSVRKLAEILCEITGRHKPILEAAERKRPEKSEVLRLISNPARARELLHWQPSVSLVDGLQRVVDFVQEHPELYQGQVYAV